LATGDDFQLVKLFKYPSVTKKSEFKSYLGHSSHVTSLRFMMNDNFLVSVGGNDKTSIIWTTDFGSEHKKLTNSRQPLELKSSNQNWDDEDEFVHKKSIRHKYADEFEQEGYTNAKIENEVEEDKENQGGLFQEEEVDVGDEFMAVKPWLGAIKAPSDYLGFKSSQLSKPRVEIELDYVFGYRSKDCRNNLFLDMNRDSGTVLMYHAAALGICLDTESNTQNFLRGHKDDVISMDYHQKTGLIATGELGPKPRIILHNSNDYSTICQLRQGVTKGVSILKFSPSGRRLAAVCINDDNSIAIFETRNDPLNGNGWNMTCITKGDRKKIITLEWINEDEILTLGKRHAKGWRYKNGSIKGSSFRPSKTCDFVVGSGALRIKNTALVLAGAVNGELQIWKSGSIISTRKDHERALDAIYCQPNNLNVFMTGGRDSLINFYDQTTREHIGFLNINQIITEQSINNRVRSIQFDPQFGHLFIGTFSSEIWGIKNLDLKSSVSEAKRASKTNDPSGFKFSSFNFMKKSSKNKNGPKKINLLQFIELEGIETEQLMAGHYTPNLKWTNEVWGLDVLDQDRYVSVSDDATLRIWNSSTRKCEMSIQLDVDAKGNHLPKDPKTKDLQESCKLRAVAVSHNKKWAAVGCKDGTVRLVDLQSGKQVKVFKPRKRWIQAIRFSPDDSLLAVGSHDSKISVFSVKNPQKSHDSVPVFSRLSNLKKHRAFITHLDFSSDGRYIHSNCGGYELLFFDCYTGEQLTSGATMLRDETWHTWSCILGWPVQGVFQSGWDGSDVNMVDRSQIQHNVSILGRN
jgi:microtubule-associated protein-like 6